MPPRARVEIKSYGPSDHDFIAELSRNAFAEYARLPVEHVLSMLGSDFTSTLVAVNPRPVGFAVVRHAGRDTRTAYLLAIAVAEIHRGCGVGRALLHAVERSARRRGANALELATSQGNLSALELFLKRGYAISARRFRYYERGQDAVVLRKTLRGP